MKVSKNHYRLSRLVRDLRSVGFYEDENNFISIVGKEDRREIIRKYFTKINSAEILLLTSMGSFFSMILTTPDSIQSLEYLIGTISCFGVLYPLYKAKKLEDAITTISEARNSEDKNYQDMRPLWEAI